MTDFIITAPDGKKYKVSGESRDGAIAALKKKLGANTAPASRNADGTYGQPPEGMFLNPETGQMTSRELIQANVEPSRAMAAIGGAMQGIGFEGGDEVMGAIGYLLGGRDRGALERERARATLGANSEAFPGTSIASQVAGAVAAPGAAMGALGKGAGLAARTGVGAAVGAASGAAYGLGAGEGSVADRAASAGSGALVGGGIGMLIPLVGAALAKPIENLMQARAVRRMVATAPSADDVARQAGALYAQADNVTLPRGGLGAQVQPALDDAARYGMDPMLTPSAARVADNLTDAATRPDPNVTYRELDVLRRQAGIPAGDMANRPQSAIGVRFQQAIDDFIDQSDPALSADLAKARELWGRLRRSEMIGDALDRSEGYLGGAASGIRNQIGSILRNPKKLRGFSEAEIALMRQIASGGLMNRFLSTIGGGIGRIASVVGGAAAGGVEGAAIGTLIGNLGREASDALLMRQGYALRAVAASGGKSLPKVSAGSRAALEALLMGGGAIGSSELRGQLARPR